MACQQGIICVTLDAVGAYDHVQILQTFPRQRGYEQPVAYEIPPAGPIHPRHRRPHNPYEEPAEDLYKLEASLTSDGGVVEGEVEKISQVEERPRDFGQIPPRLISPFTYKGLSVPRFSWPSMPSLPSISLPIARLLPHNVVSELIAAILRQVLVQQIQESLSETGPITSQGSRPKRMLTQSGIIAVKLIVHQMVNAVAFTYVGPLGVILAEHTLFGLGERIAEKVIKRMQKG